VARPILFTVCCAVAAASLLAACSDDRIAASGHGVPAAGNTPDRVAKQAAPTNIGERFASVALNDQSLGQIRGGLSTGSGVVMNFSFQEATYVNHNLTQSIVIPTLTVAPGSNAASMTGSFTPSAIAPIGNTAQAQVSSPAQAVQSIVNSGMTSIVSNLSKGGITNVVSNTANNQLVQQMISANIGITGLSQALQQSVASTVMSRVTAANSQFR
jgi:hypothetical protein